MFKNWKLSKHILMSTMITVIVCALSLIIINPLNASEIVLMLTNGKSISLNMQLVYVVIITCITMLLSMCSYIIIRNKNKNV
ncbi:MAG: hypothetical protein RRY11_08570 [Terrisporobacter sp.]